MARWFPVINCNTNTQETVSNIFVSKCYVTVVEVLAEKY